MGQAEKRKWLTLAWCLLLIALVLVAVSFSVPIYTDVCGKNEQTGEEECSAHYIATFVLLSVGNFLEDHDGAIVAIATVFIAWFTYQLRSATVGLKNSTDRLWEAGEKQIAFVGKQLDLAEKQHGLAREEYFASHPPRITVTRMSADLRIGVPIRIEFVYFNNGQAKTKKCHWNAGFVLLDKVGAIHGNFSYETNQSGWHESELAIGTGMTVSVVDKMPLDHRDLAELENQTKYLHVIGTIICEDPLGVHRVMGFCRWYDFSHRRFHVVDDPEYEFHD